MLIAKLIFCLFSQDIMKSLLEILSRSMTEDFIYTTLHKMEVAYTKNNLYKQVLLTNVLDYYSAIDAENVNKALHL